MARSTSLSSDHFGHVCVLLASVAACAPKPASNGAPPAPTVNVAAVSSADSADDEIADSGVTITRTPSSELGCGQSCRGELSPESVQAVSRHSVGVKRCYQRKLSSSPNAQGRMRVELAIEEDGTVCQARVIQDDLDDAELENCVLGWMRSVKVMPQHGCVVIHVPFVFAPTSTGGADGGP